ncbi:MAG: hypothetical protein KBT67_03915 [bacterium]|nr:hypothetical protein [Candidatus Limimorpha caballi]
MATNKETRAEMAKERRRELQKLSNKLKSDNAILMLEDPTLTVNDLLVQFYKQRFNAKELKTYEQWKNFGFQVKRGEVSFMVWGTPRTIKFENKQDPTAEPEEKDDFFPVCHLFDSSQVAPIQTKQNNK